MPAALRRALQAAVGEGHVLDDPALRAGFERDWTGRFGGPAVAVVRPRTAGEVAMVLAHCAEAGVRVVPQGGNTGLVGGGVPRDGELLLSVRRLSAVGAVDPATRTVTVGAGATLAATALAADGAGLALGIDLASRDAATIGGMVATNAGGLHVLAHGRMRSHVAALEAVTAAGELIPHASVNELVGSEGTLAVVTSVTLGLRERHEKAAIAVVGCASALAAVDLVTRIRTTLPSLVAAELMQADGLRLVADYLGIQLPFDPVPPIILLLECRDDRDPVDALAETLAEVADDVVVGADAADRRRLWAIREAHAEAVAALGIPHKLDVWVPGDGLATFLDRVGPLVELIAPGARTFVFGHVGVGNLHVNVVGPSNDSIAVDDAVLRLVAATGGDVVGEHGAGIMKSRWLGLTRTTEELVAVDRRKRSYDPMGLLNPGVVAGARLGRPA